MATSAMAFTACGNSTPKASLKSEVDTLSYAMGISQTQGLKEYLVGNLGVDTTYMNDFIKGVNEGVNAGDNKKQGAYYAGIQIGQQIANQMLKAINREAFGEDSTQTISLKNFMAGFIAATTNNGMLYSMDEAREITDSMMRSMKSRTMEKLYGKNKAEGEKFLKENAKKDGVVTLPSGVQYKVLKEGNGAIPADTSLVLVHYEGRTIDGNVFDSSYKRQNPVTLRCNQTIKGWTEVMVHMPAGSKWEVYIPQEQGYADREQGDIKPFSTLIFTIELLEVNPKRK